MWVSEVAAEVRHQLRHVPYQSVAISAKCFPAGKLHTAEARAASSDTVCRPASFATAAQHSMSLSISRTMHDIQTRSGIKGCSPASCESENNLQLCFPRAVVGTGMTAVEKAPVLKLSFEIGNFVSRLQEQTPFAVRYVRRVKTARRRLDLQQNLGTWGGLDPVA
jgi:hypothetical protein